MGAGMTVESEASGAERGPARAAQAVTAVATAVLENARNLSPNGVENRSYNPTQT